jgi:hypothetical protein
MSTTRRTRCIHAPARHHGKSGRLGTRFAPYGRGARRRGCPWSSCQCPRHWAPPNPRDKNARRRRPARGCRHKLPPGLRWSQRGSSTPPCMARCRSAPTGDPRTRNCPGCKGTAHHRRRSCRWGTPPSRSGWCWWGPQCTCPAGPPAAASCLPGSTRPHRRTAPGWHSWSPWGRSTPPRTARCTLATTARGSRRTRPRGMAPPHRRNRTARPGTVPGLPGSPRHSPCQAP